ncbi:MAG: lipopolysaccharide heptosyltransferase I [Epsilonproteobacteria bacterium]|nr:lipopolysaccharide heptosyltransferase I [Campylobacterota bacterium]
MRVAIVKLSAMGDIIHAMVALQFIKQHNPSITIDWIVEQSFSEVLRHNPDIDNIFSINLKSIKKTKLALFRQISILRDIAHNNYDFVIDAQGLIKSAISARILSKNVWGFDKYSIREKVATMLYRHFVNIPYEKNSILRNAKVLSIPFGFEITPEDIDHKKPFLYFQPNHEIDRFFVSHKKNVIFVVGSSWPSKNYPKEKFVQLAQMIDANILLVWGNTNEKNIASFIADNTTATLLPAMDLNTLKYAISKCDIVIGNDTGPTHMAWGLNIPSITLLGPTTTRQMWVSDINKALKSPSEVNPLQLNRDDFSIKEIEADKVYELYKTLV